MESTCPICYEEHDAQQLLKSDKPALQEIAAWTLLNLAEEPGCSWHNRDAIIAAGALPELVAILRSGQQLCKM